VQILLLSFSLLRHKYHERVHVYVVGNDMVFDNEVVLDNEVDSKDVGDTYKVVVDTLNPLLHQTNRNILFFVSLPF
jgi:hypothetical protein